MIDLVWTTFSRKSLLINCYLWNRMNAIRKFSRENCRKFDIIFLGKKISNYLFLCFSPTICWIHGRQIRILHQSSSFDFVGFRSIPYSFTILAKCVWSHNLSSFIQFWVCWNISSTEMVKMFRWRFQYLSYLDQKLANG